MARSVPAYGIVVLVCFPFISDGITWHPGKRMGWKTEKSALNS
jgi:hypothetical protein